MKTRSNEQTVQLGQTSITEPAKEVLQPQEVLSALWKHAHFPWDKSFDPNNANSKEFLYEDRSLASRHVSSCGITFRIISETTGTTVCLLEEKPPFNGGLVDAWVMNLNCPSCG